MLENPVFLQGVFPFGGNGLNQPTELNPPLVYRVPADRRAQLVYLRAGNSTEDLIYVLFERNGKPMRYFPIAALGAVHVELAVVEDLEPGTTVKVLVGAPKELSGLVVLDIGLLEIEA